MTNLRAACAHHFRDNHVSANQQAEQHLSAILSHVDMIMECAGIETFERDIHDSHVKLILKMALSDMMRARDTISDALAIERDFDANRDLITSQPCGSHDHAL